MFSTPAASPKKKRPKQMVYKFYTIVNKLATITVTSAIMPARLRPKAIAFPAVILPIANPRIAEELMIEL